MPNIKSQKKRVLITKEENARNNSKKSAIKTVIKKYEAAIAEGKIDEAKVLLTEIMAKIDAAKSDGIYHVNTAARKKARYSKMLDKATKAAE
ncbi:MAG: 30S ribosomal protein S20 [Clostridia bacterium]|nr:30S ribosomal protein S20 [Clostridia bacterium]